MRRIFADTFYWVALANPNDAHHDKAKDLSEKLQPFVIVTADEVLGEFLGWLSKHGPKARQMAVDLVDAIQGNPNVRVMPQTRNSFREGLDLYRSRLDKQYSLVDCVAMSTMKQEGISEVLSNDKHFEQEGFTALFRQNSL